MPRPTTIDRLVETTMYSREELDAALNVIRHHGCRGARALSMLCTAAHIAPRDNYDLVYWILKYIKINKDLEDGLLWLHPAPLPHPQTTQVAGAKLKAAWFALVGPLLMPIIRFLERAIRRIEKKRSRGANAIFNEADRRAKNREDTCDANEN